MYKTVIKTNKPIDNSELDRLGRFIENDETLSYKYLNISYSEAISDITTNGNSIVETILTLRVEKVIKTLDFVISELNRLQDKWDDACENDTKEDLQFNEVFQIRADELLDVKLLLLKFVPNKNLPSETKKDIQKKWTRSELINMYNASSTDDGEGEIETYESWLERQLLSRINNNATLNIKDLRKYLTHPHDCKFHNCQQYSDGLDGQPVDCDCGLVDIYNKFK